MTYTTTDPSILIARRGYSDLGATMDRTQASTFCGQKFGVTSRDFQPCVDHYASGKAGDYVPGASGSSGTLSQVGTFFGQLLGGAVNSYATAKGASGQTMIVPASTTPSWLLPVAIGGIGIVAIMMLRKGGRRASSSPAPVSNPARRRRRSRRSRR